MERKVAIYKWQTEICLPRLEDSYPNGGREYITLKPAQKSPRNRGYTYLVYEISNDKARMYRENAAPPSPLRTARSPRYCWRHHRCNVNKVTPRAVADLMHSMIIDRCRSSYIRRNHGGDLDRSKYILTDDSQRWPNGRLSGHTFSTP